MRRVSVRFARSCEVSLVLAVLGAACTGIIDDPDTGLRDRRAGGNGGNGTVSGSGGSGNGTPTGGGGSGVGGSGVGGSGGSWGGSGGTDGGAPPTLSEIADQYFPGKTSTPGRKRLFRLTRTQL